MSLSLFAVAGQTIYIGSDPVDLPDEDVDATDFAGVNWIQIKNWSQMGANGDAAALITTALIDRGRDVKSKGTRNAGQMQNNFAISRSDPGQVKVRQAEQSPLNYPFKIIGNDAPAVGSAPAPSQRMFMGIVTVAQEAGGQANTQQMLNTTVEINTNIVTVQPTAGAAPVNTVLPAISGIAQEGQTLTAFPGVWTGGVDSYAYQWESEGVAIPGATTNEYEVVVGDVGDGLTVVVTATNAAGSTNAESAVTADVIAA